MQRWEYKVVSLRPGHYTDALNDYGRDGWELISVASEPRDVPVPDRGGSLPVPRPFGRLEDAAAALNKLGGVLRRPLNED
jgi:hypothetical protein